MKYVLYSDIHAQVAPLEAVLKEIEKEKALSFSNSDALIFSQVPSLVAVQVKVERNRKTESNTKPGLRTT